MRRFSFLVLIGATLLACGGRTLDTPEGLPIRTYPANKDITLSFVMASCSDTCSTYEAAQCDVEVEDTTINVDVSVAYSEKDGVSSDDLMNCNLRCGPQVFAHCSVPALGPGTYTVVAKSFRAEITVR